MTGMGFLRFSSSNDLNVINFVDSDPSLLGKEINHIIYEGQFRNDIYHGYGRYIYSNGNYYIGSWQDGKRSGWGKLVDRSGKVYEGMW